MIIIDLMIGLVFSAHTNQTISLGSFKSIVPHDPIDEKRIKSQLPSVRAYIGSDEHIAGSIGWD